jgi:HK97 family phage prohead protease
MTYYIKQGAIGCDGWATVKEDGEVIGCHQSKADAIAQMVALSMAEDMQPGGEMNALPAPVSSEEGIYEMTPRQKAMLEAYESITEIHGLFNQSADSEGAHYSAESPFVDEGLVCSNCAQYEGPRGCEVVDGDISPNGICKLWIIPNVLVTPVAAPSMRNKDFNISKRDQLEQMRSKPEGGTEVETRRVVVQDFELREGVAGSMSFRGYAAVYNSPSEPLPFTETIAPGAFDKTLRSRNNVKMYLNHDSTLVLASTRAKTMKLTSDSKGLLVESDLPDTSYARDLSVLMERGDVDSMSFGFSVPSGGDRWGSDGMTRELRQIRLHEVSVVTGFPAYSATSAALRSLDVLADATGLDANKLAEALTMLENGKPLSDDHADLLAQTVSKLRGQADTTEVAGTLALKRKQIDLLLNRI